MSGNLSIQPMVSIIMPVYNTMPYLNLAVRSIFAQTYENWELIIVDDASSDGSWEYLSRIEDHRVRVFRNDKNMGNSFTCNRAALLARGDFIAKMDSDDLSFPERIGRQALYLVNNPSVDVVGCSFYRVDKYMNIISVAVFPEFHEDIVKFVSKGWRIAFGPFFLITDGCYMARREWFTRWKYDPDIPYAQDFDLNLRSHYTSVFANIPEPLYIYRRSSASSYLYKQSIAAYYKFISLVKHGFRKSNIGISLLGLLSLFLRPVFAFLTVFYVGYVTKRTALESAGNRGPFCEERCRIERLLIVLDRVSIPIRADDSPRRIATIQFM